MLKFSVLMTVWAQDKPDQLKLSLQSLVDQTCQPDELILVADGPLTDPLLAVIEAYRTTCPWIRFHQLPQNVGLGAALNEGLQLCQHELIARMDADDIALPQRFERQLAAFAADPDLSIVGGYAEEFVDDESQILSIKTVPLTQEAIYRFGKRRNPFIHPTVMYKKSTIGALGGYRPLRRGQDIDLFARLLFAGYQGRNLPEPLIKFRASADVYKRRKSWKASRTYIGTVFRLWQMGYAGFSDFVIAASSRLIMMILPTRLLELLYNRFLRKKRS